jgi:hypothetical protein
MSGGTRVGAARWLALALSGCGFGTPGGGSVMSSPLGDAGDGTHGSAGDATTDSQTVDAGSGPGGDGTADGTGGITGVGSITSPTSDDGSEEGGSSGEPIDATTTGVPPDPCANPPIQHIVLEVSAATVSAPMVTGTHPTHGVYAYSPQDGQGTVSFPFATDCEDTWRAWALIYDQDPGFSTMTDPDSFDVWLDESGSTLWIYGCQNDAIFPPPPQWSWQSVNDTGLCAFENSPMEFTLGPGPHAMHFRNEEPGTPGNGGDDPGVVAAIAEIIITNDASWSP